MVRFGRQAVVVPFVVALAVFVAPAAAEARNPPQSYVALGDSYTAGPLIPLQDRIRWGACGRTTTIPTSSPPRWA